MRIFLIAIFAAALASSAAVRQACSQPILGVRLIDSWWFSECDSIDTIWIFNDGDGILEWTITPEQDWYWTEPASGSNAPGWENRTAVSVFVDRSGFANGRHETNLRTINSNGGWAAPRLTMLVQHTARLQASELVNLTPESPTTAIDIENRGNQPLEWSATSIQPWIVVGPPASGVLSSCGEHFGLPLTLDMASLPSPDEEHSGEVVLLSNGGDAVVPVYYIPAGQSGGAIGIYIDDAGTDCNIRYDGGPRLLTVAIVHSRTTGATASQFAAPIPECWTNATYLSDVDLYPVTIGNSQTGKALGYGVCLVGTFWISGINYFVSGPPTEFCCDYPVVADPHVPSGEIEVVDCENNLLFGSGRTAIVNPDDSCPCGDEPLKVEQTTWGRVKALYADE